MNDKPEVIGPTEAGEANRGDLHALVDAALRYRFAVPGFLAASTEAQAQEMSKRGHELDATLRAIDAAYGFYCQRTPRQVLEAVEPQFAGVPADMLEAAAKACLGVVERHFESVCDTLKCHRDAWERAYKECSKIQAEYDRLVPILDAIGALAYPQKPSGKESPSTEDDTEIHEVMPPR